MTIVISQFWLGYIVGAAVGILGTAIAAVILRGRS